MAQLRSPSLARWRRDAIRRMAASRVATLALIARLSEAGIQQPRTQDQWSVKDVLVHLLTCDEETIRRFRFIARGQADRIQWFDMAHANRFNAQSVARGRRIGLDAVLQRMARARAELIARFEGLPIEALRDPSHAYPVVEWLPAPGWSHERHHIDGVRSWWRSQRASASAAERPVARPRRAAPRRSKSRSAPRTAGSRGSASRRTRSRRAT